MASRTYADQRAISPRRSNAPGYDPSTPRGPRPPRPGDRTLSRATPRTSASASGAGRIALYAGVGSPRRRAPLAFSYWNQNIAIQHENRHAYRFYEDPGVALEWRKEMQDFEAQDVEAPDKFVVFDCGQSATMIVDGVRGLFLPTLVTPLNTKHNAAVDTHLDPMNEPVHEALVHAFSNPLYAPIRALVAQIQVP